MLNKIYYFLSKYKIIRDGLIFIYCLTGKKPWSLGYIEYKWKLIDKNLKDKLIIEYFRKKELPKKFGVGIDERIVEYNWVFSNLSSEKTNILDAGSVFNFSEILGFNNLAKKNLTIYTYYPERINFNNNGVSYVYGDLRDLPFKNNNFGEIVCQSTLEHIDMDNSIYGYKLNKTFKNKLKSYEYLKVLDELDRVLKINGTLLLTFPFGRFENHGFLQQFDSNMLSKMKKLLIKNGILKEVCFFKYEKNGWRFSNELECQKCHQYNPHTGVGKENDGAAHSRAICCIKFVKHK